MLSSVSLNHLVQSSLSEFQPSPVIAALQTAFEQGSEELRAIENSFLQASEEMSPEFAPYFFHSWSMTNHSAMAVSALGNKISRTLMSGNLADPSSMVQSLGYLHRISDEDLGATGGVLHQDLFYDMAQVFCGDDLWQSRKYAVKEAKEFKEYRLKNVVHTQDQLHGLLVTAVHEIYTHAEVEFILPLFRDAALKMGLKGPKASRAVAWIKVHCNGVERDHFHHALNAIQHWLQAMDVDLGTYDMEGIFRTYLGQKSRVMSSLSDMMRQKVGA